jgi:hypothetical protein
MFLPYADRAIRLSWTIRGNWLRSGQNTRHLIAYPSGRMARLELLRFLCEARYLFDQSRRLMLQNG